MEAEYPSTQTSVMSLPFLKFYGKRSLFPIVSSYALHWSTTIFFRANSGSNNRILEARLGRIIVTQTIE